MMPLIDADYAWQIIRDAAAGDAGGLHRIVMYSADGGWEVADDVSVSPAARDLLDALWPVVRGGDRYVIAQIGQSLDGRIATASGHSHYVTGEASRAHLHRLRALSDAVLVGVDTVDCDDPQLTVRHVAGTNPARVVLDPRGRVARERTLFADAGPPTWHLVGPGVDAAPGARRLEVALDHAGRFRPADVLSALVDRGLSRVLVEGGGRTISSFVTAHCVDRLHCVVAPLIIGSGRPALALPEIATLAEARRPVCRDYALGADRLYDLDLRRSAG